MLKLFSSFIPGSHQIVFRFICGLSGGPTEDVEDLTAEAFVRASKSQRRFSGSEPAALGWLLKIARNLVIDAHRRQKTQGFSQDIEQHIILSDDPTLTLSEAEALADFKMKPAVQAPEGFYLIGAAYDELREAIMLHYTTDTGGLVLRISQQPLDTEYQSTGPEAVVEMVTIGTYSGEFLTGD